MWSTAKVLMCALTVLGRDVRTLPPIEFVETRPAQASKNAEAFIEELVTLTDFRLLLTSRERPGWLAARKVVYGEATLIEMDALAFTDEEARAVLGERKAGREQILTDARGWPAVIG